MHTHQEINHLSTQDGADYEAIKDVVAQRIIAIAEYLQSAAPGAHVRTHAG